MFVLSFGSLTYLPDISKVHTFTCSHSNGQDHNAMLFLELLKFISFVPTSPHSISLSSGTFRGVAVNGTDRWLGIPYAQPPVGPLRFKAPAVISRPTPGIQDAFQLSHACPQPTTTLPISEDCLYLNVCSVQIQRDHRQWLPCSNSCCLGMASAKHFAHCDAPCHRLDPRMDVLTHWHILFANFFGGWRI